jgi:superfamily I DNA/RNA helicase
MRTKDFDKSLAELSAYGGNYTRAVNQVHAAIGKASSGMDPFEGMRLTKFGEQRINKCWKYDLTGRCRLITVHDNKCIFLLFAGTHKACDKWLDKNRGLNIKVDANMQPVTTFSSFDIDEEDKRLEGQSVTFQGELLSSLNPTRKEMLLEGLSRELTDRLDRISTLTTDDEVMALVEAVGSKDQGAAIFDVLMLLREGSIQLAEKRVKDYRGELRAVSELDEPASKLADSEDLQKIPLDSEQYRQLIEHFSKTAVYRDWMLFMHPDQETFVRETYAGPAKISGVSGSGKTCVVVKRAIHLAEKYSDEKVLVLTLNRSLAKLISALVDTAAHETIRKRIEVLPFFQLCQRLLHQFEPESDRLYDDLTWKSKEHIDEVWVEYYRCELNNYDARVLQRVHDSLIARGIDAESYVREEFDWIRSAVPPSERKKYLHLPRTGRAYPLDESFRTLLIDGLAAWEKKMRHIGVTDYLGLSSALYKHKDKLQPLYRSVLVDECQDFGTIELDIVRSLVAPDANDIFLCGDAAQQVTSKHQELKAALIEVPGARSKKLLRNYRNSREILTAAYNVLVENLAEEMIDDKEFDVLDPTHGYFHGPAPLLLQGETLPQEIAAAIYYLEEELKQSENMKACLVICGHTLLELQRFGAKYNMPVLDGTMGIEDGRLFVSDLENTKGFEFQYVCILNCSSNVIPYPGSPENEQFRDLARLYVAMTRARTQLILSFSEDLSSFVCAAKEGFLEETWLDYLDVKTSDLETFQAPPKIDEIRSVDQKRDFAAMTGEQFLYTKEAIGLGQGLVEKMRETISGRRRTVNGRREEWRDISDAARDVRSYPHARRIFGKDLQQFLKLLSKLGLTEHVKQKAG